PTPTTPAPEPTPTTPAPEPTPTTPAPEPQTRLAKTGATANGLLLMIGAIMGGAGVGLLVLRLLEGPANKKETEL
ncbi:LPXTG cell wall anchor domain-containing protein, partial [Schaalia odontolytica]|uniref:LPXTG cell wall anchor domain-containing protein n=2 Tax=Actinomycetaceae TaxID=2049 RepID=UPI001D08390E